MKKLTLTFAILCAFCAQAYTGTERYSASKEVMQQAPPSCEWYRAHEWDFDFWGTYAISGNGDRTTFDISEFSDDLNGGSTPVLEDAVNFDLGKAHHDRFLNRDGAWGGGADVKYFFSKYWALGLEGFVVDANDNVGGAGLGTFTFRFPIGCSRFAPYGFAGFGILGGGSHSHSAFSDIDTTTANNNTIDNEFIHDVTIQNKHYEALGQFGAGLEIRVTRHVGMMTDFAWNVASGPDNNFGLARFGVTLSY